MRVLLFNLCILIPLSSYGQSPYSDHLVTEVSPWGQLITDQDYIIDLYGISISQDPYWETTSADMAEQDGSGEVYPRYGQSPQSTRSPYGGDICG